MNTPVNWRPPPKLRAALVSRAERDQCPLSEAINTLLVDGLALATVTAERDRLREELDSTRARLDGVMDVLTKIALERAEAKK